MAHLSNSFKSFKLLLCVLCLSNLYSWVGASWKHNTESMIVNSEKEEAEGVFKIAIKAEVSHIGIVGGVGQAGLEWTGYKKTGMIVGVTWNVVKWAQQVTYCPGDGVSVQCKVNNPLVWSGTALNNLCPNNLNSIFLNKGVTVTNIGDTLTCGVFSATVTNITTMTEGSAAVTVISSTLRLSVSAIRSLDGTYIVCSSRDTPVMTTTLSIPDIPTPEESSSLTQLSLSSVRINITVRNDRCANSYWVEASRNGSSVESVITSSHSSTFEVGGLLLCGYMYSFVAYTQAPSGIQSMRRTLGSLGINLSDLNGVSNINSTLSTIEWTQIDNGMESQCITGYRLSWNGGMYNTSETSVSSTDLTGAGFPYCQSVVVTVKPVTPVALVTGGSGNVMTIFQHPGFSELQVSASFAVQFTGSFTMIIQWQEGLSSDGVPVRMYGHSVAGTECTPNNIVGSSESSVVFPVPGAKPGNTFNYCVLFRNKECMAVRNGSVSVSNPAIVFLAVQSTDTSSTITVTLLPLPSTYTKSDVQIYSSIEPPHALEIVADYPTGSQQYSVEFTGLKSGTMYTFTVRVSLRSDRSTVGLPLIGLFTITGLTREAAIAVSVIITFILTLILGISIGVVIVLVYYKCRRGISQSSSTEMRSVAPLYEEPVDPNTEGNKAYGHVQPVQSRR